VLRKKNECIQYTAQGTQITTFAQSVGTTRKETLGQSAGAAEAADLHERLALLPAEKRRYGSIASESERPTYRSTEYIFITVPSERTLARTTSGSIFSSTCARELLSGSMVTPHFGARFFAFLFDLVIHELHQHVKDFCHCAELRLMPKLHEVDEKWELKKKKKRT
jgi:hypothetical protein